MSRESAGLPGVDQKLGSISPSSRPMDPLDDRIMMEDEMIVDPPGILESENLRRILKSLDVQLFSRLDTWLAEAEGRLRAAPAVAVDALPLAPVPKLQAKLFASAPSPSSWSQSKSKSMVSFLGAQELQDGDEMPKYLSNVSSPKVSEKEGQGSHSLASDALFDNPEDEVVEPSKAVKTGPLLERIVKDSMFEVAFGVAIMTNAIFIGIQTDVFATEGPDSYALLFFIVSFLYTLLFTVELVLKLMVEGFYYFCCTSPQIHWNWLDIFIVMTSLIEAGASLVVLVSSGIKGESDEGGQSTSQFRILRVLRITRLIKVIRITRIIRFIRALRTMVHQLLSTLKALMWAILLLALIIYLFAILFTQATIMTRELDDGSHEKLDFERPLFEFWATLPRSMFTLFKAITGGISWHEVVVPLADVGEFAVILFVAFISFVQFAVLNVLTGVFCQSAIDSAAHDAELVAQSMIANKRMYVAQIQNIFKDFDVDGSGSVTIQEFVEHLNDENVRAYFDSLELDTSDIWMLFRLLDADGGDELDVNEFVAGCLRLKGNAKGVDMAKLSNAHNILQNRLHQFMDRTDEALAELRNGNRPAEKPNKAVLSAGERTRPPRRKAGENHETL